MLKVKGCAKTRNIDKYVIFDRKTEKSSNSGVKITCLDKKIRNMKVNRLKTEGNIYFCSINLKYKLYT
ncbi:hypothetical protein SAMN04488029_0326 [Reichenbachiella faecimaris]|uniref:Uncharacterized protein n=1 Tax=Reichenbachiella faecimaris TaxID=692418 RepID=A0A1W2G6L7_REIFA|nr:hypothetical protein SAMN04488029_0326 [Reichenbachiella faecimaris]